MDQFEQETILRAIEEYKVSGTFDNDQVTGKVTAYRDNLKKAIPLGLKTTVLNEWRNAKGKISDSVNSLIIETVKNFVPYIKNHPELAKRVMTGTLALSLVTSMTGCVISPKAENITETAIIQVAEDGPVEQNVLIEYPIKHGDTLEGIAIICYGADYLKGIEIICRENSIENPNRIFAGQKIKLNVPVSRLEEFGYTFTTGEVNEYDAMDYFTYTAFNVSPDDVHPQNLVFWRDKQYVVGDFLGEENPHGLEPSTEPSLLIKAASARYDLEVMTGDQYGFYSDADIKSKEAEILNYYREAIEIAERNTGKKYGVDYQLDPPVVATPMEKELGK